MAWRIEKSVVRGEIDNRMPGEVTGRLWLAGLEEPVVLRLKGNCHRDMAGCRLTFTNPEPEEDEGMADFSLLQEGTVGDITAARKVKVPTVSEEEFAQLYTARKPIPTTLANSLYLEWFSEANGRIVIESVEFKCSISEPLWTLSAEQEQAQLEANQQAMMEFLDQLGPPPSSTLANALEAGEAWESEGWMDEFEAERLLQESDRRTDRYMELMDKYQDHPDQERLVAQAMGWDVGHDEIDEESFFEEEEAEMQALEEAELLLENDQANLDEPETEESEAWQDRDHPLSARTRELALRLMNESKARQMVPKKSATHPVLELINGTMCSGAKLAGALNGLNEEEIPLQPGMTVAWLKRALNYLHQALAAATDALDQRAAPADWLQAARQELLEIREEILKLMDKYRAMLGGTDF